MKLIDIILIGVFALLQVLDYYFTTTILQEIKGSYELNPAMAFLLSKFGNIGLAIPKFLSVLVVIALFIIIPNSIFIYVITIAVLAYIWVVIHNYNILHKNNIL